MTEKNEPETDKLDTSAVDKALKYVAGGFSLPMASHDIEDEDANALRVLAAEVRRLREENSALLNRVGAYDFEVTRLQKALAEEKSLTAATAEHTAQLEAKLKWFEWVVSKVRKRHSDLLNDLEREKPEPGAGT